MDGDIIKDGWCKDCKNYQPESYGFKDCKNEAICKRAYRAGQIEEGVAIKKAVSEYAEYAQKMLINKLENDYLVDKLTVKSKELVKKEQLTTISKILDIIHGKILSGK